MTLSYPLEVFNTYNKIGGAGEQIGASRLLFPSFLPKTRSHVLKYIKPLDERKHHIDVSILKRGRAVCLASPCLNYSFNHYIFHEDMSDRQIVAYLRKYKGWKPSILKRIEYSLSFIDSRKQIETDLYRWEYETLPKVNISYDDQQAIIHKEIQKHKIPYNYSIVRFKDHEVLGTCRIHRRSGWIGEPFQVEIGLNVDATLYIVMHELAHLLAYYYYRSNNHSPIFLTIYCKLLQKYMDIDFMPQMKEAGLLQGMRNG